VEAGRGRGEALGGGRLDIEEKERNSSTERNGGRRAGVRVGRSRYEGEGEGGRGVHKKGMQRFPSASGWVIFMGGYIYIYIYIYIG
jgi:hypothetical protein